MVQILDGICSSNRFGEVVPAAEGGHLIFRQSKCISNRSISTSGAA